MTDDNHKQEGGRIVAPLAFLQRMGQQQLDLLRTHGVQEVQSYDFDRLEVAEPGFGERIIGTMTDEETKFYVLLRQVDDQLDELQRSLSGAFVIRMGEAIMEGQEFKPAEASDPQQAFDYFRLERLRDMLRHTLYYAIGARLGHFDWRMGIRTKRRIVVSERKW